MSMNDAQKTGQLDQGAATRLHLEGLQAPIMTRVMRQSERGMTVEQVLPFLELQTQVWDDAQRSSRIESVSVVVYDGMPRLVLDLAFDADPAEDSSATSSTRVHAGVVRPRVSANSSAPRARVDQTTPFELAAPAAQSGSEATEPAREATLMFKTLSTPPERPIPAAVAGLALSVMEQRLLEPRDLPYRARQAWAKAAPHVARATDLSMKATRSSWQVAQPIAKKVWGRLWVFLLLTAWPALRALAQRVGKRRAAKAPAIAPVLYDEDAPVAAE